jgi:AraC-like DNA-binding protein
MHQAGGQIETGGLAAELGWSRRRVADEFREHIGLPPKLVARIIRFDRMVGRLRRGTALSWSALASESGYHDQAHLIREVRGFAGCTPTELPGHLLPAPEAPDSSR